MLEFTCDLIRAYTVPTSTASNFEILRYPRKLSNIKEMAFVGKKNVMLISAA